jgi:short-subunit dehydrogenase
MKIAITGHTKGIGLGLYQHLSPNAKGFSRTNGYDINSPSDRFRIISEVTDCDVFINNACSGFSQTYMLIDLFKSWKNLNKTIINVGSRVAEVTLAEPRHDLLHYQAEKIALKEMSTKLQGWNCKIVYKWFGYVGTDTIKTNYPNFTPNDYITVDQVVSIILS